MRRVLGRANSSNVMKVLWLLDELSLPYVREDFGGAFGGTKTPEYLALNPNSVVPTLVEGNFVLWESNAILRYLAAANAPGSAMWPDELHARANIDRWMDWQQTTLGPPMTVVFWGLIRTLPEKQDWPEINAAIDKTAGKYDILEAVLGRAEYVAGPAFSLADIAIGVHAHRWMTFDLPNRPHQPNLRAWYERLLKRPAFTQHVALPLS